MQIQSEAKIVSLEVALKKRAEYKNSGEKVAFTNGCFDLLHPGHIHYLEAAKNLADRLIIGLNTDRSVKANKGESRPINYQEDRAKLLAALGCVDQVILFDEKTPITLLKKLKPDIHIKGGDYTIESLPETPTVKSYGGKIVILPFLPGYSSTALIKKIKAS